MSAVFVIVMVAMTVFHRHGDEIGQAGRPGGRVQAAVGRAAATDNALYRTGGLIPVGCPAPDNGADDAGSMRRFMEALTDCLDVSWERQFARAQLRFSAPARVFWSRPGRGPCGSYPQPGMAVFYCPANKAMYLGPPDVARTVGTEPVPDAVYARLLSHEYGHYVQEEAGISAYGLGGMERRDITAANAASRRIELQAQCLAGAFLGAEQDTLPITSLQYQAMIVDAVGQGEDDQPPDNRDLGSSRHYAGWLEKGYRNRHLAICNTWTTPPSAVS